MLTRRHIRVKVMQCIYALIQSKDDSLEKQQKFLRTSIENMYNLYLLLLSLLAEIQQMTDNQVKLSNKSYLENTKDNYPNKNKFVNNRLLQQIAGNKSLQGELENRKLKNWYLNEEYVKLLYKEIVESDTYASYMRSPKDSYDVDRNVILELYKNVIAPNEKIYDYFEDDKLTWVDDIPIVNTFIVKQLKKAKEDQLESFFLPPLLKDDADMDFALKLLTKTLLTDAELEKEIEGKTPNWDKDRIAEIDSILLKMAICELLNFSSIPEKVTINEFLEIAKEYSTPKSSIFINGILDKLVKEYKVDGKLKKMGRGLL
ncbi:transcription antitermination factor NusB [Aurantibacter crassamenti]|uniref:transcription antitermination factor NusB n=1 Tax=Aurantibacter crassamenti TaxID=1837375 RepID=UPI00193AD766|nr:transcription antitermination factor NusB [Aurantibacter crassamenti]MBM1106376.1 transcription antitermination factor NusB [Aurantibacter crassamenti]